MLESVYAGVKSLIGWDSRGETGESETRVLSLPRKRWKRVRELEKRGNEGDRSIGFRISWSWYDLV